jgi:hypothetical protein
LRRDADEEGPGSEGLSAYPESFHEVLMKGAGQRAAAVGSTGRWRRQIAENEVVDAQDQRSAPATCAGAEAAADGRSCGISQSTVSEYLRAAKGAGLSWEHVSDWDETRLQASFFPSRQSRTKRGVYPPPDFAAIHEQL